MMSPTQLFRVAILTLMVPKLKDFINRIFYETYNAFLPKDKLVEIINNCDTFARLFGE